MISLYQFIQYLCSFIILFQFVFKFLPWFYANIIGPYIHGESNFKSFGKWALVTGATDGIGKAYAKAFAQRGLNIVLVARNLSKLNDLAKELEITHKVKTDVIDVDFTAGYEIYDKIKERIKGKHIGILVNNVGMCYPCPEYFHLIPDQEKFIRDIIMCNVTSVAMMSSVVMPIMKAHLRGLIINISSLAAVIPSPQLSLYSASKAFVDKFSKDMNDEYKIIGESGITIQSLTTGLVETKLTVGYHNGQTGITITAEEYVRSALKSVMLTDRTTGHWYHSFMNSIAGLLTFICPRSLRQLIFNRLSTRYREVFIDKGLYKPQYVETD